MKKIIAIMLITLLMISLTSNFVLADGLSLTEEEKIKLAGNIVKLQSENKNLELQVNKLENRIIIERKEADDVIEGLEKENKLKNQIIIKKNNIIENKDTQIKTGKVKQILYILTAGTIGYLVGNL